MSDLPVSAGLTTPVSAEEMRAVLQRYLPKVQEAADKGAVLRRRVLDGETQIMRLRSMAEQHVPTNISEEDLVEADKLLAELRLELRQHEAWEVVGLSMALARAIGAILAEEGQKEGWRPPEGSVLRVVLPGLLNLAIDLHDQNFVKANQ